MTAERALYLATEIKNLSDEEAAIKIINIYHDGQVAGLNKFMDKFKEAQPQGTN